MTFLFAALIAAQTAAAPAPAPAPAPAAAPAAATKFNLDTPIETLIADPAAKKVLMDDMGGQDITTNPSYDQFKGMSFNQVAPYAPDKLPAALLAKIGADLAAIK
ncbi:hypothetical protein [Sphingomonas bacterium]|uniref:hypothetical protein n=1 Tax=Sphingomonas bacterium TaxID=1895847 RepID=UPI002609DA13|nr:hypothetical protein [Sphingomonas bacterium]MDB5679957.1 hypothetical protein [Sphingomonas bacterium]